MELSLGISNQIKFGFLKFADPPLCLRPYYDVIDDIIKENENVIQAQNVQ